MLREMSEEESKENRERIARLKKGGYADRMMAILMDENIGTFGLYEDIAREKVDALLNICLCGEENDEEHALTTQRACPKHGE